MLSQSISHNLHLPPSGHRDHPLVTSAFAPLQVAVPKSEVGFVSQEVGNRSAFSAFGRSGEYFDGEPAGWCWCWCGVSGAH